jgi:hypothetical protein
MSDSLEAKTAATLLERSAHSIHLSAARLKAELGEGYALALSKRWIVPDPETGDVAVNRQMRPAMTEAAKSVKVAEGKATFNKAYQMFSTVRPVGEAVSVDPQRQEDAEVGAEVVVAENGKTYTAAVKAKNPDGTYTLSFGDMKPANHERAYKREELNVAKKKPGAPAAAPAPVGAPA